MKRRPVLFGSAAVVALWSGWILLHGRDAPEGIVGAVEASRLPRAPGPRIAAATPAPEHADATAAPRGKLPETARSDAFASRAWLAPPPPPPPPAPQPPPTPTPPPPPPAPPPLPTLPYRFVGLLDEGKAGRPRVFLALGDKLIVADTGQVLEGGFRLDSISGQELVFTHVQQSTTLRLSVQ